jgi:hypothetical protein|tara:strand:- start:1018 stop:1134 length:117 start_codon:yes stop_codon:yes gene_type:complete
MSQFNEKIEKLKENQSDQENFRKKCFSAIQLDGGFPES